MPSSDSNQPQHEQAQHEQAQHTAASDLALPEVFLLWESQRFPLRSLSSKQFVVQCEPIVRGHDPNQTAPVCNATLTGNLGGSTGDDIPVLFRVTGTDRNYARCQFAALSQVKSERIERLNSAWQTSLSAAAIKRVEAARRAEADRQAIAAQAAAAIAAAAPTQTADATSTLAKPAPDATHDKTSNFARYALASVIVLTVLGLLFARPGGDKQADVAKSVKPVAAKVDSQSTPASELKNAGTANPALASAPANSADKTSQSAVAQAAVAQASATGPSDASTAGSSLANEAALDRNMTRLDKSRSSLERFVRDHQEALAQQAGEHAKMKAQHEAKLVAATSELEQADKKVDDGETLLKDLAPLIADENIGTAEVEKIKQELADAKTAANQKRATVKRLKHQAALGFDLPMQDSVEALATKVRLIQQDIDQLQESRQRLTSGQSLTSGIGQSVQHAN